MQTGKLRTPVTVQTYTDSIAANGETTKTWSTFLTGVYAEIRPVSGKEYLESDKVQGEISHIIYMRWATGILSKMRITDGTRTFEIVTPLPDRMNRKMLTIYANEKKI